MRRRSFIAGVVVSGLGLIFPAGAVAQAEVPDGGSGAETAPDYDAATDAATSDAPEEPVAATGELAVTVNIPGATVSIDGAPVGTSPLDGPLALPAGPHAVAVTAEGFAPEGAQVLVTPGGRAAVALALMPSAALTAAAVAATAPPLESPPPPARTGLSQAWFFVSAGLALALGLGGAITGGQVVGLNDEYDAALAACRAGDRFACGDGPRVVSEYEDYQLATNVLLFSAGGAAIAALVLVFFTDFGNASLGFSENAEPAAPVVVPAAGGSGLGLALVF